MLSRRKAFALVCGSPLFTTASGLAANQPKIKITQVPPKGSGGPDTSGSISGTVAGVDSSGYKVLIYSFAGDQWYVQPRADRPFTKIDQNGKWGGVIHLGASYAALLVKSSYNSAAATLPDLPDIGGDIVTKDVKDGK